MQTKPSRAQREDIDMHRSAETVPCAVFELRCGGLHLTIQRVPGWLVAALATATGTVLAAWFTSQ